MALQGVRFRAGKRVGDGATCDGLGRSQIVPFIGIKLVDSSSSPSGIVLMRRQLLPALMLLVFTVITGIVCCRDRRRALFFGRRAARCSSGTEAVIGSAHRPAVHRREVLPPAPRQATDWRCGELDQPGTDEQLLAARR